MLTFIASAACLIIAGGIIGHALPGRRGPIRHPIIAPTLYGFALGVATTIGPESWRSGMMVACLLSIAEFLGWQYVQIRRIRLRENEFVEAMSLRKLRGPSIMTSPAPEGESMARAIQFPQSSPRALLIEVSASVGAELDQLEKDEGLNKSTLINRAAHLYHQLTRIQQQGGQIFVLDQGRSQLEELTWQ